MDEGRGDYSGVSEFGKLMFWVGVIGVIGFAIVCICAGGN